MINISFNGFLFVLWCFLFFWGQSGWYRVDCALNIERACALIQQEFAQKQRP